MIAEDGAPMDQMHDGRQRELAEQVKQVLSGIPADAWQAFLDELQHPASASAEASAPVPLPPPEWNDPLALADRLAEMAGELPEDLRRDMAARLAAAGVAETHVEEVEVTKEVEVIKEVEVEKPVEVIKEVVKEVIKEVPAKAGHFQNADAVPPEMMAQLRKLLQLTPTDPVDMVRLIELFGAYHETIVSLQSLVHRAWKQILNFAATTATGLKQATPRFLAGDRSVSLDQVSEDLDRLTTIVAGLIGGIANVGRNFANSHLTMISPNMIEDVVRGEKRASLMKRVEVCCWEEYVNRFHQISGDTIEREILQEIGKYAKQVLDSRHPGK